jgi:hypothetical protein
METKKRIIQGNIKSNLGKVRPEVCTLISAYDVAYTHFGRITLGYLKMTHLGRRNM